MKQRMIFGNSLVLTVALVALASFSISARAAVTLLDKDEWKVQLGGFSELDMFYDSTKSFQETAGNSPVARTGLPTGAGDTGQTQFSPRNSRFSFTVLPPVQSDWKTKGYLEFDLLGVNNVASEAKLYTQPTLRLRHAYASAESEGWQVLAGQYWNLFGWQTYYLPPTLSVPPVAGITYARNPQLLLMKTMGSLQAGLSIFRPIQASSGYPSADAGVRWSFDGWKTGYVNSPTGTASVQPLSVAITGTVRDVGIAAGGPTTITNYGAYGVAADTMIPILTNSDGKDLGNSLALVGEFTTGQGYGDMFPGWTGNIGSPGGAVGAGPTPLDQGIAGMDNSGEFQFIQLTTFNAYLQYHLPSDLHTYVNLGYSQLNSNNAGGLTSSGKGLVVYTRSETAFANIYHNFSNQIRAGIEYSYFRTTYADSIQTTNGRCQVNAWFLL